MVSVSLSWDMRASGWLVVTEIEMEPVKCTKRKFKSSVKALNGAVSWGRKGASVYFCPDCKKWHIKFSKV